MFNFLRSKRYFVFAGYEYYPAGGFSDFQGAFKSVKQAEKEIKNLIRKNRFTWWELVDSKTFTILQENKQVRDYK